MRHNVKAMIKDNTCTTMKCWEGISLDKNMTEKLTNGICMQ